jgi:copper(I)-binding protein
MTRLIALATAGLLLAAPVAAHHAGDIAGADQIRISHAWTEETGAMAHAIEVYVTIENLGEEADRLIAATTDFTQAGVFQAAVMQADGTVAVQDVPAVQIGAGQSVTFQPGGIHIVLNDVQRTFRAGEHFDMTLEFASAGPMIVEVEVESHDAHDHDDPAS